MRGTTIAIMLFGIVTVGIVIGLFIADHNLSKSTGGEKVLIMKQLEPPQLKTNKKHDMQVDICKYDVVAYLLKDGTLLVCDPSF